MVTSECHFGTTAVANKLGIRSSLANIQRVRVK